MLRPFSSIGCAVGLCCVMAPMALAAPGWGEWRGIPSDNAVLPYEAGFSNLELGGYLEYEAQCKQAASDSAGVTYWYRLSDLVFKIGTGQVENQCQVEGQVVATYVSTAILKDMEEPYCLKINTDVGNGLLVRRGATVTAQQIGFLPNGTEIFPGGAPALVGMDETGRQWLSVTQGTQDGWVSISAGEDDYVNVQLCS